MPSTPTIYSKVHNSGLDSGVAVGARAPPEIGGSEKGQSLISAYWSLAITASTSGFEKLSTALPSPLVIFFIKKKAVFTLRTMPIQRRR